MSVSDLISLSPQVQTEEKKIEDDEEDLDGDIYTTLKKRRLEKGFIRVIRYAKFSCKRERVSPAVDITR